MLSGKVIETHFKIKLLGPREIDKGELTKKKEFCLNKYATTDSVEYLSDYAATLVFLGEYEKAKGYFLNIEKEHPGLYATASNLGTVYELMGKNDSALAWIKKSIEINPMSHAGSEWIHVKILEFKLQKNPDFSKSVLSLDFGNYKKPENFNNYDIESLISQISHQLTERTYFVKPPDKIVGSLYFDLGNLMAMFADVETGLLYFGEARRFGFESGLMIDRIDYFQRLSENASSKKAIEDFLKTHILKTVGAGFALALVLIFLVRGRGRPGKVMP